MRLDDTALRFRNAEATADLVLPVELVSMTPLEEAQVNLRTNMSHPVWLNESPEHDGVAVLCGNGPSLAHTLDEIRELDATVFACNDAANMLIKNGIEVDYQVILEAQPRIVDELAPARNHLLASMTTPEAFNRCKNAILWHPYSEWVWKEVADYFKGRECDIPPFMYVGASATVGMFSMSLAYTMGYRSIHMFGYDSSHDNGKAHASQDFDMPTILGEHKQIFVTVEEFGNKYKTTYDMKEQVRVFMVMQRQLKEAGCKIEVHGSGLLPDVYHNSLST